MELTKRERAGRILIYFFAIIGGVFSVYNCVSGIFGINAVAPVSAQQQDVFLSRRIDQIEQRFYSIENRLNRLETETRSSTISPRTLNNNDVELRLLQSQVEGFRLRIGELECGLLKLDERTLTVPARAARRKGQESEICRANPASAVQLSARP